LRSLPEGRFSAFKDLAYLGSNRGILKATAQVMELGRCSDSRFRAGCHYDLVDVSIDHYVRVVRNDNDLTTLARFPEQREQLGKDRLRIKGFLPADR
jgi:hypothetical protein